MVELYLGLALMAVGAVLFWIARSRSKAVRVEASGGSVAVGGNNSGTINNLNSGAPTPAAHGSHWLTYLAIAVEVAGIAVTLWHASHMASK